MLKTMDTFDTIWPSLLHVIVDLCREGQIGRVQDSRRPRFQRNQNGINWICVWNSSLTRISSLLRLEWGKSKEYRNTQRNAGLLSSVNHGKAPILLGHIFRCTARIAHINAQQYSFCRNCRIFHHLWSHTMSQGKFKINLKVLTNWQQ